MASDSTVFGVDRRTWMKGLGAFGIAAAAGESASAGGVQKPDRHGPYRNKRFLVEIDGIAKAGFSRGGTPPTQRFPTSSTARVTIPTPRESSKGATKTTH